jgi:hypothetical protein
MAAATLAMRATGNGSSNGPLWILLAATLTYWAVCTLVLPVTTWDSQVYNLGRLLIADIGGFWSSHCWFSERQVMFPWAFDAVHYPFIRIGFGESLPSFLSLVGLVIIVYKVVKERYSENLALWCCLGLISMPTLIYQATSTKNDLVMVFLAACWFYALCRYQREQRVWLLAASGLSLGFMSGSKTSGLFFGAVLFCVSIFALRRRLKACAWFAVASIASAILFGSVETYALSEAKYGSPFGPAAFVRDHSNRDGFKGAAANFVRYYFGTISCGVYTGSLQHSFCVELEMAARSILNSTGLGNVGYRSDFNDENLRFVKSGGDDGSDYGVFGWIAFTASLIIPFVASRNACSRLLAIAGLAALGLICWTVAWMPWNARFLLLPFSLFAVATVIFVFGEIKARSFRTLLQILILFQIAATPVISWGRNPMNLVQSVYHRQQLVFAERPSLLPVYRALRTLSARHPRIYLMAGSDSWVLEFLKMRNIDWKLACSPSDLSADDFKFAGPIYLLVLDGKAPLGLNAAEVMQFDSGDSLWKLK